MLNDLDGLLVKVVNPTTAPYPQLRELADFLIAVKAAWRDTAEVLDKVVARQILRVPTVF